MNIIDKILDQNKMFAKYATVRYFPKSKIKKKIDSNFYMEEMVTAVTSGQCSLIEILLKQHSENPYRDADEVFGDLHIIACEVLNHFKLNATSQKFRVYTVEDFMEHGRFLKKSGLRYNEKNDQRDGLFCEICESETRCSCVCEKERVTNKSNNFIGRK